MLENVIRVYRIVITFSKKYDLDGISNTNSVITEWYDYR